MSDNNIKMKVSKNDLTGDTVLDFYKNFNCIGNVTIEFITSEYQFLGELSCSIDDFDEDSLAGEELVGGAYIQDIWINKPYRGNGYFNIIFTSAIDYIKKHKAEYSSIVLRAFSDNVNIPDEKLVEMYSRYGFIPVLETESDGVIMTC